MNIVNIVSLIWISFCMPLWVLWLLIKKKVGMEAEMNVSECEKLEI